MLKIILIFPIFTLFTPLVKGERYLVMNDIHLDLADTKGYPILGQEATLALV
jgi:hypothetical protein